MPYIARGGRPGLLGMAARTAVVAGTATAVSGAVARNQQRRAAERQTQISTPPMPVPTVAPSGGEDLLAQMERIAALHQQGVLTDDEFALAKQRLLNG